MFTVKISYHQQGPKESVRKTATVIVFYFRICPLAKTENKVEQKSCTVENLNGINNFSGKQPILKL